MISKEQLNRRKNNILRRNIAKPRTLKLLGLPIKKNSPLNICLKNKNGLSLDSLSIAETF